MCPNCRAFISTDDRVCPYCEVQLGPRAVDLRSAEMLQGFIPRAYKSSVIILTINVAFYIAMAALSFRFSQGSAAQSLGDIWRGFNGQILLISGAKYAPAIYQAGQWWRLITAGFLHASLLHIAMNMWVMFELVAELEQFYGSSRLAIIYIFSTIAGFYASLLWAPMTLSVGASAPCFGLIGAMMAIGLRRDNPMAQAIRHYYRRWAIYGLIFSFMPFMRIDIAAHVGGLAGGFLAAYVAGLPELPGSPRERFIQALAAIALAVTIYSFAADIRFLSVIQHQLASQQ
jgi:rhomboid protease GluP